MPRCYSLLLSVFLAPSLHAGGIYWSDRQSGSRGIRTCALDGSSPVSVAGLQGLTDPRGVVADARNGKLYFNDGARVMAVSFDFTTKTAGTASQIGTGTALRDLCLDRVNRYLYFTDENAGRVGRTALPEAVPDGADGTFPKSFSNAYYLDAVENAGGWMTGSGGWRLLTGDNSSSFRILDSPTGALAPLSLPPVNPAPNNIRGVQIDPVGGWVYWCEKDTFRIRRAKYDGTAGLTDVMDIYTGLCAAHGLWLDQPRGRLYWVDSGTNAGGIGQGGVNRGDVEGSGTVELLVQNPSSGQPWDLDVDVSVTSFAEWTALYFRRDAAASDKEKSADPDRDTFTNSQEFLLGMNPLRQDAPPVTAGVWTDPESGVSYPAITFVRRPLAPTTAVTPQVSTDLAIWSSATQAVGTATAADEGMERVTFRGDVSLAAAPRQFMRVKGEMQP